MRAADAVVHLAWGFQPAQDIEYLERVDVGGSRAVLRAADQASVKQLVHMSSVGAYSPGIGADPVDEAWPTPWSGYSSKGPPVPSTSPQNRP